MIKNEALNEIYDLSYRWDCLTNDLFENEFDCEFFKLLAAHTFTFLFPYHSAETLPRKVVGVLFKIKEFAACPVEVSEESNVAQLVANEFCAQIEENWVLIDGVYDENGFVIRDLCGEQYIIDANSFDLSTLL